MLILSVVPVKSWAQKNVIDEVIWIVGDEVILRSDVEKQRLQALASGTRIQGDPYCVIPEQIAIQKLFLHQASLDSVVVSESSIMGEVEYRLNQIISEIGSKEQVETYYHKSINAIREELRDMSRNQGIISEMQKKLVGKIQLTPGDVRRYFKDMTKDSIPEVPAQVELQVISYEPPVPPEEISRVKEVLRDYTDRVNSGKSDFSVLARLYSEDTESAKRGGELGFFGKGVMAPEFTAVAFSLTDPKKVSRIVQTEFGFHIIQLLEKRGDRINCRHILLKPKVTYSDRESGLHKLDSIASLIRENKITFEQGVLAYSQDKNTFMTAGLMLNPKVGSSKFEFQDLPPEIAKVAYNMNVGEVSKPFSMINKTTNKEVVAVVKLKSKVSNHTANLTDDYQMLKGYFEGMKKNEFLKNWIAKKQKETYISIDPAWQNCEFVYPGWVKK